MILNTKVRIIDVTNEYGSSKEIEGVTNIRRATPLRMTHQTKRRAESGNNRIGYTTLRPRICQLGMECEVSDSLRQDDGLTIPSRRHA
jgi:hypothetical protein